MIIEFLKRGSALLNQRPITGIYSEENLKHAIDAVFQEADPYTANLKQYFEFKMQSPGVAFFNILDHWENIEISTHHDRMTPSPHLRNMFKSADLSIGTLPSIDINALMDHPGRPRLPDMFNVDDEGVVTLNKNPYFPTEDGNSAVMNGLIVTLSLYLIGISLQGDRPREVCKGKEVIKGIIIHPQDRAIETIYAPQLLPDVRKRLYEVLDEYTGSDQALADYVEHFMPGMQKQSRHSLEEIVIDGKAAFRNVFKKVDWTGEHLDLNPLSPKLMASLSFDRTPGCPAYIPHQERLAFYFRQLAPGIVGDPRLTDILLDSVDFYDALERYKLNMSLMFDRKGVLFRNLLDTKEVH